MKFLILIVVCAGALSVPLNNQDDPLAELLQKVLEANPQENDIRTDGAIVDKQSISNIEKNTRSNVIENSESTQPDEIELTTEAAVAEGGDITDIVELSPKSEDQSKQSLDDSISTKEISKTNISEIVTNINKKIETDPEGQAALLTDEGRMDETQGPFKLDDVIYPQTENLYEDTPSASQNGESYDGDAIFRIPLDEHDNWNPNLYSHDAYSKDIHSIFEPINKDYEDHMTMLENPFLSPVDTLPLDPSLMKDATMDGVHDNVSVDYPYYDYMDETEGHPGFEFNNTHIEEIIITPNKTLVIEDTVPTEALTPDVESINEKPSPIQGDSEYVPIKDNQEVVESQQTNYNDETPTMNVMEMNEYQPLYSSDTMDKNSENLHSEMVLMNGQLGTSPFKESQNFDNQMENLDYETQNMNNDEDLITQNLYSSRPNAFDSYDRYVNLENMNYYNPYTYYPNNMDDIYYKGLLQGDHAYGIDQYAAGDHLYPDDLSMFNYNAYPDTTKAQNVKYQGQANDKMIFPFENTMEKNNPQMESSPSQDDSFINMNDKNYNDGQGDSAFSVIDSDLTPMAGVLPLVRQNPVVEIPQDSGAENFASTNSNDREQNMSLLLYNRLLSSLGKSSHRNIMNQYSGNPLRRNYVPVVIFVDSPSKNSMNNDMPNDNQMSEVEEQGDQLENNFISDDGTVITDLQHNVDLPYSPGYHPAFYHNMNQYPYGYKTNPSTYPYHSNNMNYYPSQDSDLGHYNGYYTGNHFRNRDYYYPYSDDYINSYALRNYYRKHHLNFLHNYYY